MVPVGARGGGVVGKRTARSSLLLVLVVQGASKRTGSVHEHRAVVTEERTAIDARRVGTGGGLAREERVGELVEVALNEARAIDRQQATILCERREVLRDLRCLRRHEAQQKAEAEQDGQRRRAHDFRRRRGGGG